MMRLHVSVYSGSRIVYICYLASKWLILEGFGLNSFETEQEVLDYIEKKKLTMA